MYNLDVKCNHSFDFLNEEHYLIWLGKFADCEEGCTNQICKEKKIEVNGLIIKMKDFEVKK